MTILFPSVIVFELIMLDLYSCISSLSRKESIVLKAFLESLFSKKELIFFMLLRILLQKEDA